MGSKRTSRRELLQGGAALAGGITLGELASSQAQAHDHPMTPGSENASPMILGSKELVEYGQRSRYVTSVRIQHPPGGRPSPDAFGKQFHIATPLPQSGEGSIDLARGAGMSTGRIWQGRVYSRPRGRDFVAASLIKNHIRRRD